MVKTFTCPFGGEPLQFKQLDCGIMIVSKSRWASKIHKNMLAARRWLESPSAELRDEDFYKRKSLSPRERSKLDPWLLKPPEYVPIGEERDWTIKIQYPGFISPTFKTKEKARVWFETRPGIIAEPESKVTVRSPDEIADPPDEMGGEEEPGPEEALKS